MSQEWSVLKVFLWQRRAESLNSDERTDGTPLVIVLYLENPGYTHDSSLSD